MDHNQTLTWWCAGVFRSKHQRLSPSIIRYLTFEISENKTKQNKKVLTQHPWWEIKPHTGRKRGTGVTSENQPHVRHVWSRWVTLIQHQTINDPFHSRIVKRFFKNVSSRVMWEPLTRVCQGSPAGCTLSQRSSENGRNRSVCPGSGTGDTPPEGTNTKHSQDTGQALKFELEIWKQNKMSGLFFFFVFRDVEQYQTLALVSQCEILLFQLWVFGFSCFSHKL